MYNPNYDPMTYPHQQVNSDKVFANKHLPALARILKQNAMHLIKISVAAPADDFERATDLVIKVKGGDVAVRIRRAKYAYRDLTIRTRTITGMKTERDKIKEGFARWYIYGWLKDDDTVGDWILVDVDKLRASKLLDTTDERVNKDGSKFICIPYKVLEDKGCIIDSNMRPQLNLFSQVEADGISRQE